MKHFITSGGRQYGRTAAIDAMRYCYNDIITTMHYSTWTTHGIKKVIFNDPATIVLWADGTKTIVKCSEDDVFDREKGLAMAISKRYLGENFRKVFKEFLPEEERQVESVESDAMTIAKAVQILNDIPKIFKKD